MLWLIEKSTDHTSICGVIKRIENRTRAMLLSGVEVDDSVVELEDSVELLDDSVEEPDDSVELLDDSVELLDDSVELLDDSLVVGNSELASFLVSLAIAEKIMEQH